jgi:hypothetical protein
VAIEGVVGTEHRYVVVEDQDFAMELNEVIALVEVHHGDQDQDLLPEMATVKE